MITKPKIDSLIKKYNLADSEWIYKGFHGIFHTFFPVGQTGPAVQSFLSQRAVRTIFFAKDNYIHWYWNENDLTFIREEFFKRLKKNKNYLANLKKAWARKIKIFEIVLKKIDHLDLAKLSNQDLVKAYNSFYEAYSEEFKYFMVLGDAISMPAEKYLVPEFKKVLGPNFAQDFPALLATRHLSFIEEEALAREKLIQKLAIGKKLKEQELSAHAAKYFYITNNYARGVRLTGTDFKQLIIAGLKNRRIGRTGSLKQAWSKKQKIIKKYKLTIWQKTLLWLMDEFFGIQDTRKKYVLIANFYQFKFLEEISRRTKISLVYLKYLIFPEVADCLRGKISRQVLKSRIKGSACLQTAAGFYLFSGRDYRQIFAYFFKDQQSEQELKGLTASLGRARGRVKKILKIHDMVNMEKGDILVSSMTRPEMVPAMKLAAAIITDEGGITSHAAIISRELKIPCVIGTKIATQILNDGDEVEVNADQGIIKILKRK
ncbi:MAG: PEP-utilizing enzyme [Patescibacteria group bacterium]